MAEIREILLTHAHHDHAGQAADLAARSGAPVLLHRRELAPGGSFSGARPHPHELVALGVPPELSAPPGGRAARARQPPAGGGWRRDRIRPLRLELIWTPGRSPGLLSAFDRERGLLSSSDHVLARPSPVAIRDGAGQDPVGDYLESIDRLRGLRPRSALPGHGRPLTDFNGALEETRRRHREWLRAVQALIPPGGATAVDVASGLGWLTELGNDRMWLAVARAAAYLLHLVATGAVVPAPGPPVRFWSRRSPFVTEP